MFLTLTERNALVEQYIPLANALARHKAARKPKFVSYDDLRSAALLGLVQAASTHNPDAHSEFRPHRRIIGEMQDYLRSLGWGTRTHHITARSMEAEDDRWAVVDVNLKFEVQELLEKLNEIEKRVIVLYYYDQMTLKEIAGLLGLSLSRVWQIKREAEATMRDDRPLRMVA